MCFGIRWPSLIVFTYIPITETYWHRTYAELRFWSFKLAVHKYQLWNRMLVFQCIGAPQYLLPIEYDVAARWWSAIENRNDFLSMFVPRNVPLLRDMFLFGSSFTMYMTYCLISLSIRKCVKPCQISPLFCLRNFLCDDIICRQTYKSTAADNYYAVIKLYQLQTCIMIYTNADILPFIHRNISLNLQ